MRLILSIWFYIFLTHLIVLGQDQTKYKNQNEILFVSDSIFVIDKRIEVFNVLQWLSKTYHAKTELTSNYSKQVEEYFNEYKSHEAVLSLDKLISFGFSYDAPISFFLHVDKNFDSIYPTLQNEIIKRAGGINNLTYFLKTVKSFVKESHFNEFYINHVQFYNSVVGNLKGEFLISDIITEMESYYGFKLPNGKIILSTLTSGGFGPSVINPDGEIEYITVASPVEINDSNQLIYFIDANQIRRLLWHELSHPIVNPLVEKYWNLISKHEKIISKMKSTAPAWYRDDKALFFENIVRAITIEMAYIYEGKESGIKESKQQINWGFYYATKFASILKKKEREQFENRIDFLFSQLNEIENSSD